MADTENTTGPLPGSLELVGSNKALFKRIRFIVGRVIFFMAATVFCFWQIAFLIFSLFLVLPEFVPEIWVSYRYFDMPWNYFVLVLCLLILPLLCLGVIVWLFVTGGKKRFELILKFFYGFELPALFLLGLYLINMRDYEAGMSWLLINTAIALCLWGAMVFYQCRAGDGATRVLFVDSRFAMAASSIVFAIGFYVSLTMLLFIIPLLALFIVSLFEVFVDMIQSGFYLNQIWNEITSMKWSDLFSAFGLSLASIPILAFMILAAISTGLVLVLPFVLTYLYIGQFILRLRESSSMQNALVAMLVLTTLLVVHIGTNKQPQQSVLTLLESPPVTAAEQRQLIEQSEQVRDGLMNAYLARYRYLSSTQTASVLTELYADAFSIDEDVAKFPQQLLNFMFKPLLYNGNYNTDAEQAAQAYEQYFDAPIQKAELDEIWQTLRFNSESSRQNAAGLLDVSQESVYLASQSIDLNVEHQLATVRVTQKLVNKVKRRREAVMHFSLPEYAVVTGVWLSNDENNLEQFGALVAPRGAAQEVYNREVARRIDPALLEKVGPDLYRLRVYPILPARVRNRHELVDGKPMYVSFEYQTLAGDQGVWPVPRLLEKRHLYWDGNTVDTVNGELIQRSNSDDWIPIEAGMQQQASPVITTIPGTQNHSVWAVPRSYLQIDSNASTQVRSPQNMVVLIDGSRSMEKHASAILAAVNQMQQAKIFFCQKACVSITAEAISEQVYWGNGKPIEQLKAFVSNASSPIADNIVLLTDDGSYEAESDTQAVVNSAAPVWVLHLGERGPYAYSDAWLTTINQSGGDFNSGDVSELLEQLSLLSNDDELQLRGVDASLQEELNLTGVDQDWLWFDGPVSSDKPDIATYEKLGAALEISRISKSGQQLAIEQLDALHAQAIQAQIVTELSSMIVLVNDAQKNALKEAEEKDDRFDRENENGTQVVGVPNDALSVAGVPEPHEWALLIIVMAFATMSLYRRHQMQNY